MRLVKILVFTITFGLVKQSPTITCPNNASLQDGLCVGLKDPILKCSKGILSKDLNCTDYEYTACNLRCSENNVIHQTLDGLFCVKTKVNRLIWRCDKGDLRGDKCSIKVTVNPVLDCDGKLDAQGNCFNITTSTANYTRNNKYLIGFNNLNKNNTRAQCPKGSKLNGTICEKSILISAKPICEGYIQNNECVTNEFKFPEQTCTGSEYVIHDYLGLCTCVKKTIYPVEISCHKGFVLNKINQRCEQYTEPDYECHEGFSLRGVICIKN